MSLLLSLGSELWLLRFDSELNNYVPRCEGKVTRIVGETYYVGHRAFPKATWPMFGSEADARAWIAENPFSVGPRGE